MKTETEIARRRARRGKRSRQLAYIDGSSREPRRRLSLFDRMMRFEDGNMSEPDEVRALMVDLRNSGMLYRLQGFYGRTAASLGVI